MSNTNVQHPQRSPQVEALEAHGSDTANQLLTDPYRRAIKQKLATQVDIRRLEYESLVMHSSILGDQSIIVKFNELAELIQAYVITHPKPLLTARIKSQLNLKGPEDIPSSGQLLDWVNSLMEYAQMANYWADRARAPKLYEPDLVEELSNHDGYTKEDLGYE